MHIAETRAEALADVAFGLPKWIYYFQEVGALPLVPQGVPVAEAARILTDIGLAVIGDPDDAAAQIDRLTQQSGGFGTLLMLDHNWAEWAKKRRSYELIARYVMPRYQRTNEAREASLKSAVASRGQLMAATLAAITTEIQKELKDRGLPPDAFPAPMLAPKA